MGENEGWAQPSGIVPNGLLQNEVGESLIRILDRERWLKAEKRTAELICRIQPNKLSDARREAVTKYVVKLVTKCFPCKVVPFGSVPLKTYLPDGDIDLTTFSTDQNAKDTWANMVCDVLQREEKNVNAEYRVKEVQYIQAEVKLVKCLVDNIVVDISFNQLGGLCTLCFLEEVNSLIENDFLFKRSIILIKAWCYYESRILGAHHGLISTYALETLVLYIFHVYNNSFAGPLEVLYRFLEFFSNFDWENFCISLWGPVPVKSLPDMTPQSPRKDSGDLLLKKKFLEACYRTYSVVPGALETQGQPFAAKFFNVIDPLRANNNLGRSVSKGNFFRIRSAFAFGAKRLARLVDCPANEIYLEVNQFFMNTWSRHGSGMRPDALSIDFGGSRVLQTEPSQGPVNYKNGSRFGSVRSNISHQEAGLSESRDGSGAPLNGKGSKIMVNPDDVMPSSLDRKAYTNYNSRSGVSNVGFKTVKNPIKERNDMMVERGNSDGQIKFSLARTHSSPELHNGERSQGKLNFFMETGNTLISGGNKKSSISKISERHNVKSSVEVPSSSVHKSARANESSSVTQYHDDLESVIGQGAAVRNHSLKQKEQNIANISMVFPGFNGAVPVPQPHFPLNSSAVHLSVPMGSFLASAGYIPRNVPGGFSGNPSIEHPWGSNVQIVHGMLPPQMAHYFPNAGQISNLEDMPSRFSDRLSFTETNSDAENETWIDNDHDASSSGGFEMDNRSVDMQAIEDQLQSNSSRIGSSHSASGSGNLIRNKEFPRENKGSMTTASVDSFQYSNYTDNDFSLDRQIPNIKNQPISHHCTLRSRTSSESSWDGSSAKTSKTAEDQRGRKIIASNIQSAAHQEDNAAGGNTNLADDDAYIFSSASSTVRTNLLERNARLPSSTPSNISRHQFPGSDSALVNGSNAVPLSPMVVGPSQNNPSSDSGAPFTFFPTGPPVPFLTMLPLYNFPSETMTAERSSLLVKEEGLNKTESVGSVELSEMPDKSEDLNTPDLARKAPTPTITVDQQSDILNGDFPHHLTNLYYGRLCQLPNQGPLLHPSAAVVPPMYLQGQVPWVGPGRPSANLNQVSQYMSYGPRFGPLAPFQTMSYRPVNPYQQMAYEMPRHRSGTGTYLPNPAHIRERPSSGTRRGNNNDRSDHNSDREGNWNQTKLRASGRSHTRSLADKSSSRLERWATNESRDDRSLASYSRSDSFPTQNGHLNPDISSHGNLAYGMHPKASGFHNAVSSSGQSVSPMMMIYPYDQYRGYGVSADHFEFGSLGQVGQASTSGENEMANDQSHGNFEDQVYRSIHAQWASPDQPSSPHVQRRT